MWTVTNVINYCVMKGVWPHYLKSEIITPIPKVSQPQSVNDLRPIANLRNMNKIIEKLVTKLIVEDMKPTLDPAQYANQKGIGIQHYLIKMIDRILASLDVTSNDNSPAALVTFIDFKEAFTRQDATLGILSFIRNKVRPGLIPMLISFFEDDGGQVAPDTLTAKNFEWWRSHGLKYRYLVLPVTNQQQC